MTHHSDENGVNVCRECEAEIRCQECGAEAPVRPAVTTENDRPHEFVGSGGVCHLCGRWDLNGIHAIPPGPAGSDTPM